MTIRIRQVLGMIPESELIENGLCTYCEKPIDPLVAKLCGNIHLPCRQKQQLFRRELRANTRATNEYKKIIREFGIDSQQAKELVTKHLASLKNKFCIEQFPRAIELENKWFTEDQERIAKQQAARSRLRKVLDWSLANTIIKLKWFDFVIAGEFKVFVPYGLIFCPVFFVSVYLSVILHELGHALAAMSLKHKVKKVSVNCLGGTCEFSKVPPRHLFYITLFGPLSNLALWAMFLNVPHMSKFASLNLLLCVGNMLPIFPLDGGRIVLSLLSLKINLHSAAKITCCLGVVATALLDYYCIFYDNNIAFLSIILTFFSLGSLVSIFRTERHEVGELLNIET